MRKIELLFLALLLTHIALAQDFKKKEKWFRGPGKVQLTDGKVLSGEIYYSFQFKIVQVIKDNKSTGFKSDKIAYFEYYDEGFEKKRKFYVIPYNVNGGRTEPVFFEVLKELSDIALLKTQQYLNFDLATGNSERLTEVLYFADNKGNIKPYVEIVHKLTGKTNRLLDKNGLAFVTKRNYNRVRTYLQQEKLNEKKEEDIILALEYFETIR